MLRAASGTLHSSCSLRAVASEEKSGVGTGLVPFNHFATNCLAISDVKTLQVVDTLNDRATVESMISSA